MKTQLKYRRTLQLGLGLLLGALSLATTVADETTNAPSSGLRRFMEQDYLLGDWGGWRTKLSAKGIDFEFFYAASLPDNLDGGLKRGGIYQGAALLTLDLDSEKLAGYHGGRFHVGSIWTHGEKAFSDNYVGDLNKVNLIDFSHGFRLWELYYEQKFLDDKARSLSRSVVSHLRWDLNAIFKMAAEDSIIPANSAGSLVTPKEAKTRAKRTMTKEQVRLALSVLDLRDRIIFLLAVLVGMRPGEILALRWARVDSQMIEIAQRVYRGLLDDPKTERGKRQAALPPDLAGEVDNWRNISPDTGPDALVFPSERGTYLSRDNFLRRNIQKKLEEIGLGWVNFQVLRRTQASLGHKEGVDPKVAADQRGHAIGVAIDTYTESDLESRREAVTKLELALAGRKPAERAAAADSSTKPGFRGKRGKAR